MKESCFKGNFCSKAFTLIELLVVVLIIGILAAVAVPQYRFAVDKAAFSCLLPILQSVTKAQRVAALERGGYPTNYFKFENLDIDLKVTDNNCKKTDMCGIKCAGKGYTLVLRNEETWANFYFFENKFERVRYKTENNIPSYSFECQTTRCRKIAKSLRY